MEQTRKQRDKLEEALELLWKGIDLVHEVERELYLETEL